MWPSSKMSDLYLRRNIISIIELNQVSWQLSGKFGLSGFWTKGQYQWFFNQIFLRRNRALDWDIAGRNYAFSCREVWGWLSTWVNNFFFDFWECPDFDAKNQLSEIWIQSFYSCKVADYDAHKGNRTGNCWEKWVWRTISINDDGFFSEFSDYGDCDARHRATDFSKQYSFRGRTNHIETWMKEFGLVFLERNELQHRGNSKLIALFGISSTSGWQNEMFQ